MLKDMTMKHMIATYNSAIYRNYGIINSQLRDYCGICRFEKIFCLKIFRDFFTIELNPYIWRLRILGTLCFWTAPVSKTLSYKVSGEKYPLESLVVAHSRYTRWQKEIVYLHRRFKCEAICFNDTLEKVKVLEPSNCGTLHLFSWQFISS